MVITVIGTKGFIFTTVEEMFQTFTDLRIEIEIKDDNPPELIDEIASKLWTLIQKYQMEDKNLIAYLQSSYNDIPSKTIQKEGLRPNGWKSRRSKTLL